MRNLKGFPLNPYINPVTAWQGNKATMFKSTGKEQSIRGRSMIYPVARVYKIDWRN